MVQLLSTHSPHKKIGTEFIRNILYSLDRDILLLPLLSLKILREIEDKNGWFILIGCHLQS